MREIEGTGSARAGQTDFSDPEREFNKKPTRWASAGLTFFSNHGSLRGEVGLRWEVPQEGALQVPGVGLSCGWALCCQVLFVKGRH